LQRPFSPNAVTARVLAFVVVCVGLIFTILPRAQAAPTIAQNTHSRVYLPLVRATSNTSSPSPSPSPSPAPGAAGALFFGDASFRSADIAVDAQGGMHVAFTKIPPLSYTGEAKPVYYAYCPPTNLGACANQNTWSLVELSNDMPFVQLELTPQGQPRMLLHNDGVYLENQAGTYYQYAECNAQCSSASSWTVIDLGVTKNGGGFDTLHYAAHFFKLDPLGRPRFIYTYGQEWLNGESVYTRWYLGCDSVCTDVNNWRRVELPRRSYSGDLENASLAFTPDGRPRFLAEISDGNHRTWLVYLECAASCAGPEDWTQPALLLAVGSGSGHKSYTLALDSQGRPRVAAYPIGGPMRYLWCDAGCSDSTKWQQQTIFADQQTGMHPALVLDKADRPRIAYQDWEKGGLGYIWCAANCNTSAAEWRGGLVEDDGVLDQTHSIKPLPTCVRGGWQGGKRPALSLDAAGNPRIAYDAEYLMECYRYPDNPSDRSTYTETKWWTSRVVFFPQP